MSNFKILDDYFATKENVLKHEVDTIYDYISECSSMRVVITDGSVTPKWYAITRWRKGNVEDCADELCNEVIELFEDK